MDKDITIRLAQQPEADALLGRSPLAALVGMLLDQQVPMEWAFSGPWTIAQRLGSEDLDAHAIAAYDPEAFAALLSEKPAVHRYPGSMATRIQQLCAYLVEHYDGDAEAVWADAATGKELLKRLKHCPASASRRPRSSSPCWASGSGCGRRAGGRPRAATARRTSTARRRTSPGRSPWPRCGPTNRR